jgi:methyl-accepting chemotaxis protein
MSWLKNRSIGTKLSLLSGIPMIVLILITMFYYFVSNVTSERFISAYENYSIPAVNIAITMGNLQGTQKNVLKTILVEDPSRLKEISDEFDSRRAENERILGELDKIESDPATEALFSKIMASAVKVRQLQDECIELGVKERKDEARAKFFGELEAVASDYEALLLQLSNSVIKTTDTIQKESANAAHEAAVMGCLTTLISTLVVIVLNVFISRAITVPVNTMRQKISLFATGDLTLDFSDNGRDAISQMGNELELMSKSLHNAVTSILDASDRISDSSKAFLSAAEETNASVEAFRSNVDVTSSNLSDLASSSEEINASVEEVAAGAQTTAEKGTDIARKVDDAMRAGDNGMTAVHSVVDGISRVSDSSSSATSAIMELGNRARQIQGFVSQIGSIADQTNLLALNAAIEAARAGEAGRGFAVVAEEVRKLAEDSNVAAKNIADLASAITSELDMIVKYAQDNAADSNKAKDLSSETEKAISNMIAYLKEIAGATQDLAAVAEEQAASSEEIAEAVQGMSGKINETAVTGENIRASVTDVASTSERVAEDAEMLSKLSEVLQEKLLFFKLGSTDIKSKVPLPKKRKADLMLGA